MAETNESIQLTASQQDDIDTTSQPFVGRWNHLVSTTNWDKGRIIAQWREALSDTGAPSREYSDEAWSLRVGGVTGQHVGRLRRVYQRFGSDYENFDSLYWSHFQAALDWEDAEMWLEGAVQNRWSVSQMRRTRWETLGALPDQEPREEDVITNETDEDFEPAINEAPEDTLRADRYSEAQGPPIPEGPDFGDESESGSGRDKSTAGPAEDGDPVEYIQPFADLKDLPDDLADAFEQFKLTILRHKTEQWTQVSRDDVLASLDALKALATAP